MPVRPSLRNGWRVKTASLPIVTPCSLLPISAPHIQKGRLSSTACVRSTCGIRIHVQETSLPLGCRLAGCHSRSWASFGSRSEFLANSTRSLPTTTRVSHTGLAFAVSHRAITPGSKKG